MKTFLITWTVTLQEEDADKARAAAERDMEAGLVTPEVEEVEDMELQVRG